MRQKFSFNRTNDETANTLVLAFNALVDMTLDHKNNTDEYKEANKLFSENIVQYCMERAGMTFSSIEDVKNPMVYNDAIFQSKFNQILAQAITPAVPTVAAAGYEQLFEVHQVGFGDGATYTVDSNELYIVNDVAEGILRGGQQTIYNKEYTISASRKQTAIFVDWYKVASGVQDWGKLGNKIGASYIAYIYAMVVKAMGKVITDAEKLGIAGYKANGFTDQNWLTLARNVSLANGGAQVYALGTNIALGKILPSAAAFRFGPDSDIVTDGVLPAYKNVPMVELGNALIPGTINDTPKVLLGDDFVYMIAMGSYKPCKVVIEGNQVAVEKDPTVSKDHTYGMHIDMRIGVDVIVGSKFGYLALN